MIKNTERVTTRPRGTIPGCIAAPKDRGMCHADVQRALRDPADQWCQRINEDVAAYRRRRLAGEA